MRPLKIISGGQTGADQGGLHAARLLGIPTGGTAPCDWMTENGPAPWLSEFGLVQHRSSQYAPRTRANIAQSDGTIIFGRQESGSLLTYQECVRQHKPVLVPAFTMEMIRAFIKEHSIKVLNVAGNRESHWPGMEQSVKRILIEAFSGQEPVPGQLPLYGSTMELIQ